MLVWTRKFRANKKNELRDRLLQDSGAEGCALTPSCESTGNTTNCWTIINRKTLELTKKDTPHLKTKEKLQWDGKRGWITIKSNPITAGWVTHKLENNYTTEVQPLEWRFWAPYQASEPGDSSNRSRNFQRIRLWRLAEFDCRTSRGLGETETPLLEGTHRVVCASGPRGKEQWPHRRLNNTCLLVLEDLLQRWRAAVAHHGDKDTGSRSTGKYSLLWALPESAISPSKEPVASSAG